MNVLVGALLWPSKTPIHPRLRIPGGVVVVAAIELPKPLRETIMNKLYSSKSNAKRGAVKDLGSHALVGVDYRLVKQGNQWTWTIEAKPNTAQDEGLERDVAAFEATLPTAKRSRSGTKQALVIDMLRRPEGATIAQIVEATSWQSHTARGAISGAIKKKLGLPVTSEKIDGRGRVYRIEQ